MAKEFICSCSSTGFIEKEVSPHRGLFCANCGKWHSWIKHPVEHDPNFTITFGQHKGTKISLLPTAYLMYGEKNFKGALQKRFSLALEDRARRFQNAAEQILAELVNPENPQVDMLRFVALFQEKYPYSDYRNIFYWLNRTLLKDESQWKITNEGATKLYLTKVY